MSKFSGNKSISLTYERSLRKLSKKVSLIIKSQLKDGIVIDDKELMRLVSEYVSSIEPWAKKTAASFVKRMNNQNKLSWTNISKAVSKEVKAAMTESKVGLVATQLQNDQVELIKSIPLKAAERAQELSREAMITGTRNQEIANQIAMTEQVTNSRAKLIARTETAKANSSFTIARAESIGITHYIWRTMQDEAVRDSHSEMEGTIHEFASPPTLPDGNTHHPGNFPNCRCYPEPIIS